MSNPTSYPRPFALNPSTDTNPNNNTTPSSPTTVVLHDDLNGTREQIKDNAALLYEAIQSKSTDPQPDMNLAAIRANLFIALHGSPSNIFGTIVIAKSADYNQPILQHSSTGTKPYVFVKTRRCRDQPTALAALLELVSGALGEAMQGNYRYTRIDTYGRKFPSATAVKERGDVVMMIPEAPFDEDSDDSDAPELAGSPGVAGPGSSNGPPGVPDSQSSNGTGGFGAAGSGGGGSGGA